MLSTKTELALSRITSQFEQNTAWLSTWLSSHQISKKSDEREEIEPKQLSEFEDDCSLDTQSLTTCTNYTEEPQFSDYTFRVALPPEDDEDKVSVSTFTTQVLEDTESIHEAEEIDVVEDGRDSLINRLVDSDSDEELIPLRALESRAGHGLNEIEGLRQLRESTGTVKEIHGLWRPLSEPLVPGQDTEPLLNQQEDLKMAEMFSSRNTMSNLDQVEEKEVEHNHFELLNNHDWNMEKAFSHPVGFEEKQVLNEQGVSREKTRTTKPRLSILNKSWKFVPDASSVLSNYASMSELSCLDQKPLESAPEPGPNERKESKEVKKTQRYSSLFSGLLSKKSAPEKFVPLRNDNGPDERNETSNQRRKTQSLFDIFKDAKEIATEKTNKEKKKEEETVEDTPVACDSKSKTARMNSLYNRLLELKRNSTLSSPSSFKSKEARLRDSRSTIQSFLKSHSVDLKEEVEPEIDEKASSCSLEEVESVLSFETTDEHDFLREIQKKKLRASWAKSSKLQELLQSQTDQDLEQVFSGPLGDQIDLEDIFQEYGKKSRYRKRTVTGDWNKM